MLLNGMIDLFAFFLSVGCADSSPIEGAKRRKKAAFGEPSVRKGLQ